MNSQGRFLLILLVIGLLGASPMAMWQRQTGAQSGEIIDYIGPPDTLRGLWDKSRAVLQGTVVGCSAATSNPNSPTLVYRHCTITIVELLKSDGLIDLKPTVRVMQYGGTVDVNGKEMSTSFPADRLEPTGQYILFLGKTAG